MYCIVQNGDFARVDDQIPLTPPKEQVSLFVLCPPRHVTQRRKLGDLPASNVPNNVANRKLYSIRTFANPIFSNKDDTTRVQSKYKLYKRPECRRGKMHITLGN